VLELAVTGIQTYLKDSYIFICQLLTFALATLVSQALGAETKRTIYKIYALSGFFLLLYILIYFEIN